MSGQKSPPIHELLSALDLERRGWAVVDHWEGDACAVGVARTSDPRRLVYVSAFNKERGTYDYECEMPSGPSNTDYMTTDRGENVTFQTLLRALQRHLKE